MPTYTQLPFPWGNVPPPGAPVESLDVADAVLPMLEGTARHAAPQERSAS